MNPKNNHKTLRHFQCRDYLWETFEQMSGDLDCSTDYLINEAMRQYARAHNYGGRGPAPGPGQAPGPSTGVATSTFDRPLPRPDPSSPIAIPTRRPAPPIPAGPTVRPPPPRGFGEFREPTSPPLPPPYPQASSPSGQFGSLPANDFLPNPGTGRSGAGPLPGDSPVMLGAPPLYVVYNGQRQAVSKSEFVIGRGSRLADLVIRDGNVSRRHAAVVFESGAYYMRDLGSTNGVEFQGRRVTNKRIEEGDVFHICDYEMRFTYL